MATQVVPGTLKPKGYVQLTSLGDAAGLTVPAGAEFAYLQATAQDVRWRDDGTVPTASVGMVLTAGAAPLLYTGDLRKLRFIQTTSGSILNVSFYALGGN